MVYVVPKKDQHSSELFTITLPGTDNMIVIMRRPVEKEYLLQKCSTYMLETLAKTVGMPDNKSINEICEEMKNYIQFEE